MEALYILVDNISPEHRSQAMIELAAFLREVYAKFSAFIPTELEGVGSGTDPDVL